MAQFLTALEIREVAQDRWVLLRPLIYESDVLLIRYSTTWGHTITVPVNFTTDLESIPRVLPLAYAILYGTAHKASVVHDWLYTNGGLWPTSQLAQSGAHVTRKQADDVLYEAIVCTGEPRWKAWLIWLGVRAGGWVAWNKHRKV